MNKSMIRAAVVSTVTAGVLAAIAAPPAQAVENVCVIVTTVPASNVPHVCVPTPFSHRHEVRKIEVGPYSIEVELYYPFIDCPMDVCPVP